MASQSEWEVFFDGHAPIYMQEVFTRDTVREVDFLVELLGLDPGAEILDIGCGTGRHSVELARRGFRVTGVDLSRGMLAEARKAAEAAGVDVEWIKADAATYRALRRFDAVVCLCEGAFCLLGMADDPETHDRAILRAAFEALHPGGRFVLTAINGLRKIRAATPEDVVEGRFDPSTLIENFTMEASTPEGKRPIAVRERGYLPGQLAALLRDAGFAVEHVWGGTAGRWGRRPLELDEIELMVVSVRPR
ncbi:MAG: cyclopropane-fatty-acyl-phospholipid synthase [Chloroflexi bacterium RBG_13_66_10]|nr:MAG: cyclopropane-fatty-acyl-phospholipid synthase [Chloroflexi bacterium RBG_13_66_10]